MVPSLACILALGCCSSVAFKHGELAGEAITTADAVLVPAAFRDLEDRFDTAGEFAPLGLLLLAVCVWR